MFYHLHELCIDDFPSDFLNRPADLHVFVFGCVASGDPKGGEAEGWNSPEIRALKLNSRKTPEN